MEAIEVGHLRGVAGVHQGLVAGGDERCEAAAEHDLLAEEVGLALFLEGGLDDARAPATDGRGVGKRDLLGIARGVLRHRDETGNAAAEIGRASCRERVCTYV